MLVRNMKPDDVLEINGVKIYFAHRSRITFLTQAHIKIYDRAGFLSYERQPEEPQ